MRSLPPLFWLIALNLFVSALSDDCRWSMTAKETHDSSQNVMFAGFVYDLRMRLPAAAMQSFDAQRSRPVDVMVTQLGGDHICEHPRAVLYLDIELQPDDDVERALSNLPSSPSVEIVLRVSSESRESPKVLVGNFELPWASSDAIFGIFLYSADHAQLLLHIRARYSLRYLINFVYLVQSDSYMDLSGFTSSDSHALQLLWKGQCPSGDPACIDAPGVSWTTGRNILYNAVLRYESSFNTEHMYLIFFDDDAELEYARFSDPMLQQKMDLLRDLHSPWRTFENYLLEYQPAIGFPYFGWQERNQSLEVQSVPLFDAMITAFHAQVWPFMFPYETRWDKQSWHWSLSIHSAIANMFFPNHRVQFNTLSVKNTRHRPYPRGGPKTTATAWFAAGVRNPALIMRHKWDLYGETPLHFMDMPVYKLNSTTLRYSDAIKPLDIDVCHPYWRSHGFVNTMNCGEGDYDMVVATFDVTLRLLEHQQLLKHKESVRASEVCAWGKSHNRSSVDT